MNSAKGRGFNSSRLVAGCCAGVVGLAPGWRRHHGIVASPEKLLLHFEEISNRPSDESHGVRICSRVVAGLPEQPLAPAVRVPSSSDAMRPNELASSTAKLRLRRRRQRLSQGALGECRSASRGKDGGREHQPTPCASAVNPFLASSARRGHERSRPCFPTGFQHATSPRLSMAASSWFICGELAAHPMAVPAAAAALSQRRPHDTFRGSLWHGHGRLVRRPGDACDGSLVAQEADRRGGGAPCGRAGARDAECC